MRARGDCNRTQIYRLSVFEVCRVMTLDPDTLKELESVQAQLNALLPKLTKWKVEELQHQIAQFYTKAWTHRKTPKYGSIQKGFNQDELDRFFAVIKDERWKLLFSYQAFLALRIGEAVVLNMKDFNFEIRELRVRTEKAHTLDTLKLPDFLFEFTLGYIKTYNKEIENHKGYLFYPDENGHSKMPHVNLNYTRRVFRYYAQMAGLTEIYDTSEESLPNRHKRNLYRLSTHSLRHYGITRFNRAVHGDIILTQKYARHREIGSTQVYIYTSKDELYSAIDVAFSKNRIKEGVLYRN
jgi:integrase